MDAQQFAYWLQGFAELGGDSVPTEAQWKSIREHLATVFKKVTPKVGIPQAPLWPQQPTTGQPPLQLLTAECMARPAALNDGCGTMVIC